MQRSGVWRGTMGLGNPYVYLPFIDTQGPLGPSPGQGKDDDAEPNVVVALPEEFGGGTAEFLVGLNDECPCIKKPEQCGIFGKGPGEAREKPPYFVKPPIFHGYKAVGWFHLILKGGEGKCNLCRVDRWTARLKKKKQERIETSHHAGDVWEFRAESRYAEHQDEVWFQMMVFVCENPSVRSYFGFHATRIGVPVPAYQYRLRGWHKPLFEPEDE